MIAVSATTNDLSIIVFGFPSNASPVAADSGYLKDLQERRGRIFDVQKLAQALSNLYFTA